MFLFWGQIGIQKKAPLHAIFLNWLRFTAYGSKVSAAFSKEWHAKWPSSSIKHPLQTVKGPPGRAPQLCGGGFN
jgi:hypothetical protein